MRNKAIFGITFAVLAGCSQSATDITVKNTSNAAVAVTYQTAEAAHARRLTLAPGSTIALPDTKGGFVRLASIEFRDSHQGYVFKKEDGAKTERMCGASCTVFWRGDGRIDFKTR